MGDWFSCAWIANLPTLTVPCLKNYRTRLRQSLLVTKGITSAESLQFSDRRRMRMGPGLYNV